MKKRKSRQEEGTVAGMNSFSEDSQSTKNPDLLSRACDPGLSSERYRAFIESISDGVYETDVHGNFLYFNNSLCRIFGYPKEEILGHNFSKFMDRKNAKKAYDAFSRVFITRRGFTDLIWEIIRKDSEKRIIELSANLILDDRGKKIGFRGIARDVTERYRAQEALKESEQRYHQQYELSRKAERNYRILLDFVPYPMVVFTVDGKVTYLNPAFTEVFGWTLAELQGKQIPYVPPELKEETRKSIERLFKEKVILRHETKRLTKEGKVLDVVMRGAVFAGDDGRPGGELVILRDITEEKRLQHINESLLRISLALPEYPELEDLLDYISGEINQLLNTEGALVILLDEERNELFFLGAAYDDTFTQKRAKEIRFPASRGISGRVIRTGQPQIVPDATKDPDFNEIVDRRIGYRSRNMLDVPLKSGDRIIGVLCASNKRDGEFNEKDIELLNMIGGTVALSVENARYARELKEAYQEVVSLNRAKDKVINHLSHELKTPVSVLLASLNILGKKMEGFPEREWKPTLERAQRNLERILEIQYEVEDIMQEREYRAKTLLSTLLDTCSDELEALVAEEIGEGPVVERIRRRIEEIYGPREGQRERIGLDGFVKQRLEVLAPRFSHRQVEITSQLEPVPDVCIPSEVMEKVFDGLLKNAIENTPDEGKIEVEVKKRGEGSELVVRDYGIGITEEHQRRIFEGFFSTQETMAYSSKRPFDFNAGGKGADLLRMKIFSERYGFRIDLESKRCPALPKASDTCPGRISQCSLCKEGGGCHRSGGTQVTVTFPPHHQKDCNKE
ncbi:MAG: PAS domain S-box protein [Deltaproteobacteria bacterium]|nr:PAS domain S-box protein [Deltaproteobacteria bacterium]MBW2136907.1 PAS domain S-box protein [Deltaproteobacteria bacterium]